MWSYFQCLVYMATLLLIPINPSIACKGWGVGHASATFEFSPNFSLVYMEFCKSLFSRSEWLIYYALNMITSNPSGFTVEPHSKYWYICIEVETYFTTLLRKCRAISHWMAVRKNRGKCESATISLHRGNTLNLTCIVCIACGRALAYGAEGPGHARIKICLIRWQEKALCSPSSKWVLKSLQSWEKSRWQRERRWTPPLTCHAHWNNGTRGRNKPKIWRAIWVLGIKNIRVLIFFSGPDLVFLISFIHNRYWNEVTFSKGHLGPGCYLDPWTGIEHPLPLQPSEQAMGLKFLKKE